MFSFKQNSPAMKQLLLFILMLVASASMAQVEGLAIPDWYDNPPVSNRKVYASGNATASTAETATKMTTIDAKVQLARKAGRVKYPGATCPSIHATMQD